MPQMSQRKGGSPGFHCNGTHRFSCGRFAGSGQPCAADIAPPYLELARLYSLLKDFKSAREILDLVLKVDPGNYAARQEWQKLASSSEESP